MNSWKDYTIVIGEYLSKNSFGFNPKKKVFTRMCGENNLVVDINNQDIYWMHGFDKLEHDHPDPDGKLREQLDHIKNSIDELCGSQPDVKTEIPATEFTIMPPVVVDPPKRTVASTAIKPPAETTELSIDVIKRYINDKATDEEAYVFMQLCKARNLNPFTGDVYLIKYDHVNPATMVVGKDAFMKRAESHKEFNGFEAGIIIQTGDTIEDRPGTFYLPSEKDSIVGGWAKVYRKDLEYPTIAKVAFGEYVGINSKTNQPNRTWASKPATMIRKVALVQALREAFPSEFSGMYDSSEMGVEI